jgi:hypothetical protein
MKFLEWILIHRVCVLIRRDEDPDEHTEGNHDTVRSHPCIKKEERLLMKSTHWFLTPQLWPSEP